MSRMNTGDVITVAPTNNVYTALAAAGFAVVVAGAVLFFMRAQTVLGVNLFSS